jgi:hypothetical protein
LIVQIGIELALDLGLDGGLLVALLGLLAALLVFLLHLGGPREVHLASRRALLAGRGIGRRVILLLRLFLLGRLSCLLSHQYLLLLVERKLLGLAVRPDFREIRS